MANNLVNPNTNFLDPNHWKTLAPAAKTNFLSGIASQNDTSGESKYFKGLTVNEENEIFAQCDRANVTQYERNLMANDLYKKKLAEKTSEKKNSDKAEGYMDLLQRAAQATDQTQKNQLNGTARKHEVADMIRNYVLNANGEDLTDIDDEMLIHDFTEENPQSAFSIDQYVNSDMSQSYFSRMMGFSQADEDEEQSGFEQRLNGLGERFQAFGKGIDNLLSKGQASIDESGVDLNAYTKYIQDKYGVSYPAKLDKETRDKEYAAVKENPELLKPYMTSTADDVLDVAEGGVDIAFSTFNPYATAGFTAMGGLESIMGGGALTWFGEKMGGIGSVINELPGLSQFRDSLSEENQARFDQFVANSAMGLMLGVKNKSNIYKNPKQFLIENLQPNQITKNFMENVVGISEKAYGGLQRAGNFARGIEGGSLAKAVGKMSGGLDSLSEWGAEKLTKTSSAQDKLYKAQEPRMNVLSNKKNLEKRRANSDRANELIIENGFVPKNTAERLDAHQKTLDKLWGQVMKQVNEGEGVFADQSSVIDALDNYIKEQEALGIDASKSDIQALKRELDSMKKQQREGTLDFPTLEKKKQVFNDLIDWKGVEASEVYKKGIRIITHEIGKVEDAMLSKIPGEFSELKRDVGALLDSYEDVFKADMKNQRKKGNGLVESYSRIEGIGDTIAGIAQLFRGDISGVAKGLSKVALGKAMAKASDVDFLIKKGFSDLYDSYRKEPFKKKTVADEIKTNQAVFDELVGYIAEVNKGWEESDVMSLGKMIDENRKNLSLEDYRNLKEALRDQTKNWDIDVQWDEWLKTEGQDIINGVDSKAVKDFQSRILKIENEEKNVGKVAGKKVNRAYAEQQQRNLEAKRERLIEEIGEYYGIDQFEAANKYDELRDSANVNKVKYQTADDLEAQYEAAVKNGDEARAKEILKEYAESKGYNTPEDYKGRGTWVAPSADFERADFKNLDAMRQAVEDGTDINLYAMGNKVYNIPDNMLEHGAERRFWRSNDGTTEKSFNAIRKIMDDIEKHGEGYDPEITVYRTVPNDVKAGMLESGGEWVTPAREYAEHHGLGRFGEGEYKIIEEKVKASELWWDGNDINEWGFDDGKNYVTKPVKNSRKDLEITYDDNGNLIPLSERFNEKTSDTRYQKYGTAGEGEKGVNAIQGLNIRNFKNGKSVKELADNYGIKTHIVQSISTPEGQKAYGMYGDRVITLARDLKESTVPHELLHATFDMVDQGKKNQILDGIKERLKVDDVQAEEWLADNFSEYYRTGKFDTKAIPTTFVGQIKQFFQQIKEYIDGTYANRKEIQNLFDDIIDGKLEGEYGVYSDPKFQSVWHGSPADFDKFDSSHMGEGEGAQAHGWGHYVAVNKETGENYASMGGNPKKVAEFKGKSILDHSIDEAKAERGKMRILSKMEDGKTFNEAKKETINEAKEWVDKWESMLENKSWDPNWWDEDKLKKSIEEYKNIIKTAKDAKEADFKMGLKYNRNLYNIEIPDPVKKDTPTGSNYLEEDGAISKKELEKINNELLKKEGYLDIANNNKNLKSVSDMTKEDIENIVKKADKGIYDKVLQEKEIAERRFQTSFSTLGELFDTQLRGRIPLYDYAKLLTEAGFKPDLDFVYGKNGKEVYRSLESVLGSDKKASKFLESLGYDGIHYFGGRDGEAYVIFNDDALKINSHEQY